ncbi:MAG TPA: DUF1559 domain-containing protein [Gemmatales bacterium]|nr:DUF1559 domain-containing protein [Gemmatales bacterium]
MCNSRRGMTLLETLVVLSVIVFLITLSIPAIQRVRAAADRTACQNQLRQLGQALHLYHHDYGALPPQGQRNPEGFRLSWMVFLLPYIEQKSLHDRAVLDCRNDPRALNVFGHQGMKTVVRLYVCPSDSRLLAARTDEWGTTAAFTSYIGAAGGISQAMRTYQGAFSPSVSFAEVHDGLSNTLCLGERPPPDSGQGGWWYPNLHYSTIGHRGPNGHLWIGLVIPYFPFDPQCGLTWRALGPGRTSNPCDRFHFWSLHGGGSNFLFVDGSVRFLSYSADPILPALISINGGEPVTVPD